MDRLERGRERYNEVYGDGAADRLLASLRGVGKELGRYGIEFNYGDIYSRPGLDLRERQIATISSLVTLGNCERQLAGHIKAALNVGLSARQILEVIVHCVQYIGFPRTLNAVAVATSTFDELGIDVDE
ncbi:carboxymuconolactone decarboxylase family protein [Actinopolymorpha alba]|uniref:carboxymuconolactone decarboxylase family protein n=1 Tax=Actinopolymorpha alba TaxID=533267 RepID=UPI00036D915D|nr:carboxymuconolactone decarboxylase family protein [Actinopolymorpha alba]